MSNNEFRWGIIGLGSIARQFATGLKSSDGASLAAVGSRTQDKADAFAKEYGSAKAYASYEEVASDPDVDAIYIATPHTEHAANAKLCIEHGKPVLVEKPFAVNATQAREVVDFARRRGVFCMEAMWSRFFPIMGRVRDLVAQKAIGEVRLIQSDFGFRAGWNPEGRLLNPALAGGGLLDVGVYPISLASMLLGKPDRITGFAHIGETGVDEVATMLFGYEGGKFAQLSTGVRLNTPQETAILGEEGSIRIHSPWWKAATMTVKISGKPDEVVELPYVGNGYNYEADEVKRRVEAGKLESSVIPLDETLQIMETMDELRRQWGLKYPADHA